MLTVYYKLDCVDLDMREFKTKEEFEEWHARQIKINQETVIIKIEETP